jgi:hypothetical protein
VTDITARDIEVFGYGFLTALLTIGLVAMVWMAIELPFVIKRHLEGIAKEKSRTRLS